MPANLTHQLISSHLEEGELIVGQEIALRIDQTLTQDATGTLVMLELEAMGLDRVRTEISAQYVDHNLIQADHKNPDDHLFLESACRKFGIWFSPPGNGVSHPVHQERFGIPGKTLLGSDSHTPAAGAIGMLAMGAGGLEVAMAMAGEPYRPRMPKVFGVELVGKLPDWVSAKDVILEMLRRHDVDGAKGCVIEYHGPGLECLSTMDRHVIANMGTELGATSTVFPSDLEVKAFLVEQGRESDWIDLRSEAGCRYDLEDRIDLSQLEPLMALPSSPGNVVPVRDVAGEPIYQSYIGSSANPGYRDFAIVAEIVKGRQVDPSVSFDINPTSRQILLDLIGEGHIASLLQAGARLHQAGCNGCIGMGQAPASGKLSLRTVPRNFPGRSGTAEDRVCLVSPETAAASALRGRVTDPRELEMPYPKVRRVSRSTPRQGNFVAPSTREEASHAELVKGPNIQSLSPLDPLPESLILEVLYKAPDDLSTDEILPAGTRVLPFRSNIPEISKFAFEQVCPGYHDRAMAVREYGGHAVIGGDNYGQGSSREHAALAPRFLGLRLVLAKGFARIHRQNLVNYGILPLIFTRPGDYQVLAEGDILILDSPRKTLERGEGFKVSVNHGEREIEVECPATSREREILLEGGAINLIRTQKNR